MGQPSSIDDPKHWYGRAEEARAVAEFMIGDEAKRIMLSIAASYERLGCRAQERLKTDPDEASGFPGHRATPPSRHRGGRRIFQKPNE